MNTYNNINENEQPEEEEEENQQEGDDMKLEKDFFETNKKSGKFTVICGRKGSGKSWMATNYISISYFYNLYDEYHFILPEYETDASSETYSFIEGHKNTTVYGTYTPEITQQIKKNSKNKKILYVMDDATSYLFENKNKPELLNLVSTCRHGKGITIIVICHALKTILTPSIRGLIDFMFIGAFTNYTLIKRHLWEEQCSMMIKEDEFMDEYKRNIIKEEHNFLYINGKCEFSFTVNNWNLSTFDRKKAIKREAKIKVVNIDKNYKIKQKIKDKNNVKTLESQFLKKEPKKPNDNIQIYFKKPKNKK